MSTQQDVYGSLGQKRKKFINWQARTILVSMLGYAMFLFREKELLACHAWPDR